MPQKRPAGQMVPTQEGTWRQFWEDGSYTDFSPTGAVVGGSDSPNPRLAAALMAGVVDEAELHQVASRENARRWDITSAQADRGYDIQANQIANNYKVALMGAKTAQEAQRATARYQQDQSQLMRDRLAFDRESFGQTHGLAQARLGYDLVETGARLHNDPADYFNEAEWARGVAGRPDTSTFLSALQNNTRLADFSARGSPAEVNSYGALTAKLTGGGGVDNSGNYLAQIGNIGAKGPHQLGAGSLEQLTDTEQKLFTGGLSKLGYDPSTFLQGYARSRIGQGFGSSRAA